MDQAVYSQVLDLHGKYLSYVHYQCSTLYNVLDIVTVSDVAYIFINILLDYIYNEAVDMLAYLVFQFSW